MSNKKHYIITSITLGLIAMASAALIGVTNLITKNKIAENEIARVNKGITDIFGENARIVDEFAVDNYQYVNYAYRVNNDDYAPQNIAHIFKADGSNMYGKISLLVGFTVSVTGPETKTYKMVGLSVVTNEQTYASTLEENYIDPVKAGERDYEDVSCGATYGAKLIRAMLDEAKLVVESMIDE